MKQTKSDTHYTEQVKAALIINDFIDNLREEWVQYSHWQELTNIHLSQSTVDQLTGRCRNEFEIGLIELIAKYAGKEARAMGGNMAKAE